MKCNFKTYCSDCESNDECLNAGIDNDGCCQGIPGYPDSPGYCSGTREASRRQTCQGLLAKHIAEIAAKHRIARV
jgi:hypothetical protein